jgi:hypothetical protein
MTESLSQHPGLMEDIGPHIIHPTPSLLPEGELREGRIYLLKPSGERYGSKIGNVLTEENIKKLPDYRLIIV